MQFILDLFFSMTFILLLIILEKIKERTFSNNRDSYRYVFLGLAILSAVSLFQMGVHQNLINGTPFLSEPIYQELIQIIGIIAGIALMIAGISIWLPTRLRNNDKATNLKNRAVSDIKFESMIEETKPLGRLYRQLPAQIARAFEFEQVIIIKKSHGKGQFFNLGQHLAPSNNQVSDTNNGQLIVPGGDIEEIITSMRPDYHFKYQLKGKIDGAILCWGRGKTVLDDGEKSTLEKIADTFSKRLYLEYEIYKRSFYENGHRFLLAARDLVQSHSDLKGSLRWIYELYHKATGAEYLSFAILDKFPQNYRRYTVGINGNVLLDGTNNPPLQNDYIDSVIDTHQSLILPNIDFAEGPQIDTLFISCGQKSLLALPIICLGRPVGAIILGSPQPGRFHRHEMLLAEILLAAIAPLVNNEVSRRLIQERDHYLTAVASFEASLESINNIDEMLDLGAETILQAIGTTMVRITILGSDRKEIATKALKTIRSFENIRSENVTLTPELLYWHYMVTIENRPFLINQNDGQSIMDIPEAEALVFKEMQSALIVPIVINGLTYGLITLGEMRHWERFRYDSASINFCKAMAAIIGTAIKSIQLSRAMLTPSYREHATEGMTSPRADIRNRLREPMTSLSGSIDLLKIKGIEAPGSERILANMEKSADRLVSIINEER
jgi:GAF domain-containing protein